MRHAPVVCRGWRPELPEHDPTPQSIRLTKKIIELFPCNLVIFFQVPALRFPYAQWTPATR